VHTTTMEATNATVPVRAHRGQITASIPFARGPNRREASKGIAPSRTPSGQSGPGPSR
jgi:hypothetical protein